MHVMSDFHVNSFRFYVLPDIGMYF